ncbi:group 1 glycosyl transferase [Hahella sp. CCB-MM4]|uniref:TIGR03087 family PEP-CTERM/XrtA system glycosyltransferase n=1 Tax=Hahella sp. (strain CCB-MM4) TaxID=1926491 RepID=UPI000B9AD51D|nr:TIGR03087 family PEP-CTERM/XrtA system glycosyltransferase [Hahella sp. CCB-MM4]OZG73421.1 group 1 glycosyl transferase [Hahella sp. CCB-MM4]
MKILFISHRVPFPPNKGEKIRTFHQIKFLVEKGHSITVVAPYEDEDEIKHFQELERRYKVKVFGSKLKYKSLRLLTGLLTGRALSVANFYSKPLQQEIDQHIQSDDYDAIVCTASSMAEYVFRSKTIDRKGKKPRLIMDFMDLDSDKWRQYAERSSFPMSWIYRREAELIFQFEKEIAESFDACLFVTEAETELFRQYGATTNNVYAIENGMDPDEFRPSKEEKQKDTPVLLFTGVMDYSPNVDAVVWFVENVWKAILNKWPDAEFYIAGMNPNEKVKSLEKEPGVQVTGFVDDILPYFDRSTIFVAPFRIARGVQNKVLQAFACGIPVIATPMGAEGIRYQEGENILLADTADDFMAALEKLLTDSGLYQKVADNALETIQRVYSWRGILEPFEELLATGKIVDRDTKADMPEVAG